MEDNSELNQKESVDLAIARKNMYGFLSRIFLKEPTKDIVEILQNPDFLSNLSEMEFNGALDHFNRFSESFSGEIDDLEIEYSRLFIIPDKKHYVTPYESVYLTGMLSQAPTVQVKRIYDKNGLEISQDFDDFPDHIGIELEYMHYLCNKEAQLWDSKNKEDTIECLDKEKEFLEKHLGVWTQNLSEKILNKSENDFYKGFAELLTAFIEYDKKILNENLLSLTA
jgi:DMSO reductase family type II enzyme chaperone